MRLRALMLPVLAALLLLLVPPALSRADTAPTIAWASLGLGPVTAYTLPNGLKVLVAPSQAADLVTLDLWLGAGTRRETAQNNGAAHFMEHLLFKGTPTRPRGEIDAEIEDLGGTLNAATSYDWAHFYVTVGSTDADAALKVLADAVMNAQLRQEDMDVERSVILSEMAREMATPTQRLARAMNALTFPDHPYGRPLLGTKNSISEMKRQTVLDFYHTFYVPGNATLVITGRITPEAGVAMAQRELGAWPARPFPEDRAIPEQAQADIRVLNLTAPVSRGSLILGFHAPSVKDQPDTWVMDVLLTLLGQGGNNRLQQDLQRKQKLVTSISANYLTQRDPGVLSITAEFDPGSLDQVRGGILAELAALRQTPVSDAELAAAKHALLASYLFDAQTSSGRADALGFYNTIDTYRYDTEYISHFSSVTAAQVQDVARRYLDPRAYTLVTLLPPTDPITASNRSASNP